MRILVAFPHYFSPEADPRHSSTDARRRAERIRAVQIVIESYRGMFGPAASIDIETRRIVHEQGGGDEVHLALVTVPGACLADADFCRRHGVMRIEHRPDNPRMLGFHVHELFAALRHDYDLFVFSEDDLRPSDPWLFAKIAGFVARHGDGRVLLPNRYEWNARGPALKTYVDGDLRSGLVDPLIARVPAPETLRDEAFGRPLLFRRARNPHAGFFAVTRDQLARWIRQPHWLDRDTSFVSPLESAATLGLTKSFAVYKPWGRSLDFLELQHLDHRFSTMQLPAASPGLAGYTLAAAERIAAEGSAAAPAADPPSV